MERLTQVRPTAPYRADCGHLCNCFPFTHRNEQTRELEEWYEHDIFDNATGTGTECGRCYRARMDALPPMSMGDVVNAFRGGVIR